MTDTHVTRQTFHMTCVKHVSNQSIVFTQIEHTVIDGHDACCILATML